MQIFADEFKKWIADKLTDGEYGFSCRIRKDDYEILFTRLHLENITPHTIQITEDDLKAAQSYFLSNDDFILDARS